MSRIGWLDCSAGVAGDMLLGTLSDLGVLDDLPATAEWLPDIDVQVTVERTHRHGLAATAVDVRPATDQPERRLDDVLHIVSESRVPEPVKQAATSVFERLAAAEAAVHGVEATGVHFHEVGAVDAIVDVVGSCLGLHRLGLDRLVASPIRLGSGEARSEHGPVPVPAPAVLRLLADAGLPAVGGGADAELATPTGVALVAAAAEAGGAMPAMTVEAVGAGAGRRDLAERPNLLRLVVGSSTGTSTGTSDEADGSDGWRLLETNIDDLDPRLWPGVIDALLAAGAADAWLTPILMKKGRPAHTLTALVSQAAGDTVRDAMLRRTTTLGVREHPVGKQALDREWREVAVAGRPVRIKLGLLGGQVVTATPEWSDVQAAAVATGAPERELLAAANAAAQALTGGPAGGVGSAGGVSPAGRES